MKRKNFPVLCLVVITAALFVMCEKKTAIEPEPENIVPICSITQPISDSSFTVGDTVEINLTASDDGQIVQINLYIDNLLIHTDFENPFRYLWNTAEEDTGTHLIYAEVIDDENATGISLSIRVIVAEEENHPPSCIVIHTSTDEIVMKNDTLSIEVVANDEDGQITHIKFYIDNQLVFDDFESPYLYLWDTSETLYGEHDIRIETFDNDDNLTTQAVAVTVNWRYRQPEQVSGGWETASLEHVNLDRLCFEHLITRLLSSNKHLVHGILVIRNGYLVFEHYFNGLTHPTWGETHVAFDRDRLHVSSSVTKSFTAALLGIAIECGFISSADNKVFDYYPEFSGLKTEAKQEISLRHLVTMSSGLEWDEWTLPLTNPNNDLTRLLTIALNTNDDPFEYILGRRMVAIPGEVFNYSGGSSNLLGNIILRASGLRLDAFANEYLFKPLGIEEFWWWVLRPDFVYTSGDLALKPRDMAKFGQLFLQNGYWDGERIVSEEWVTLSATPQFYFNMSSEYSAKGYSYGWWPCKNSYGQDAYSASGWGGQEIFVMPEHDMVVVFTGGSYWEDPLLTPHEMMVGYVLPSIQ